MNLYPPNPTAMSLSSFASDTRRRRILSEAEPVRRYWTTDQLSKILGIPRKTLNWWIRHYKVNGWTPAMKKPGFNSIRFPEAAAERIRVIAGLTRAGMQSWRIQALLKEKRAARILEILEPGWVASVDLGEKSTPRDLAVSSD